MKNINFNGKHYEVGLPFREEHPLLPDNHAGSLKRLNSLITRLKAKPDLLQEYNNIIQDQMSPVLLKLPMMSLFLLDIFITYHIVKLFEKIRIRQRSEFSTTLRPGTSLNDGLHTGPSLSIP